MAGPRQSDVLRFRRMELQNWRNFSRVQLDLQRRAFLIGPNASGKSNLLDVFRFLRDIASVGGGLAEAVRLRDGVTSLRCLAARRYSDLRVTVDIRSDNEPEMWKYDLAFSQDNMRRPVVKAERVIFHGETLLDRPTDEDNLDPERLTQTNLEQIQANQSFRQVGDFFRSLRYLHIVPQLVREPKRSVGIENDPFGGDFLQHVYQTNERTKKARLVHITGALQVAVPQLRELELVRDEESGDIHLRGRYDHWRPQGAWQNERQFSDGTLRLIGLLWAALDGVGPLLLEEPELSLHPEVVRYLPQMFARIQRQRGRQVVLSTHSVEILLDEGIGLDEVLLLSPAKNGTSVAAAGSFDDVVQLMRGGLSMAEAVIPRTTPKGVHQLALFGM